jgi:hypothetical protein
MRSFADLQSLFAAYQATAIGLQPDEMKICQGAAVVPTGNDQVIWDLLDQTPAPGLVLPTGSDGFFDAYVAVIAALVASSNPLDPIAAAKRNLADWGARPAAWDGGYKTMTTRLNAAPRFAFKFDIPASTGTKLWGLWRQSDPSPGSSARLASGAMAVSVHFGRLLNFAPPASDWYTPSAMTAAYQNPNKAPWNPASATTWETTFGANGALRSVVAGLICVADIAVDYTSSAPLSAAEQDEVAANAGSGLWPYYVDGRTAMTRVTVDPAQTLSVTIATDRTTPIIIGASVQTAASFFVGH